VATNADERIPGPSGFTESRPVPDPTLLTTQQLFREIYALREIIEARLDAGDKAILLLQDKVSQEPATSHVAASVVHLKEVSSVRWDALQRQLLDIQASAQRQAAEDKVALSAALASAEKSVEEQNRSNNMAVAKSEASTAKQMDQIHTQIVSIAENFNGKVDDLKARVSLIEGRGLGIIAQKTDTKDNWGVAVAVGGFVGLLLAAAGIAVTVASLQ
jgi:hypothetical protein